MFLVGYRNNLMKAAWVKEIASAFSHRYVTSVSNGTWLWSFEVAKIICLPWDVYKTSRDVPVTLFLPVTVTGGIITIPAGTGTGIWATPMNPDNGL
jgi:hypothetical protein